jgi:hypothetical protein
MALHQLQKLCSVTTSVEQMILVDYRVFGTLSIVWYSKKIHVLKTGSVFILTCREEGHLLSWVPLKKRVRNTEYFFEYQTIDKVRKLSSPDCNIPLSEPFRIEMILGWGFKHATFSIKRNAVSTKYVRCLKVSYFHQLI